MQCPNLLFLEQWYCCTKCNTLSFIINVVIKGKIIEKRAMHFKSEESPNPKHCLSTFTRDAADLVSHSGTLCLCSIHLNSAFHNLGLIKKVLRVQNRSCTLRLGSADINTSMKFLRLMPQAKNLSCCMYMAAELLIKLISEHL